MIQGYHDGEVMATEQELASLIASSIGKQKGMDASTQLAFSFSVQDLSP